MERAPLMMAVLMVVVLLGGALAITVVSASSEAVDVHHDLRTDAHVSQFNESGEVTNSAQNTKVSVVDTTGFVRVKATNPNGYATDITIDIPADVVAPAELGDVEAVAGEDVEADWYVRQDLSTGTHHTRVEVTLPANSNVTLAPSKPRLVTLAWTGDAQAEADGIMDRLQNAGVLEENKYTLQPPKNGSTVAVELTNPNDGSEEISEYHAMYSTDNGSTWHPVGDDAEDPVYVTQSSDGDRVEYKFNDPDAKVEFTANPGFIDSASYHTQSYVSGFTQLGDMFDSLPLTAGIGGVGQ